MSGGFNDKDIYNIQLATDEAASNIIEHAYEGVSDGLLELSCGSEGRLPSRSSLWITANRSIHPMIPAPDLKADLSERKIGGLGIFLMRKLMDEVHYESRPERIATRLTMTKRRG
ncbi:MAG: ATP-binding protein [Ignavibacteriales bacterium]|nr:ATP-binding protein [Ignavibacteriales bacterium]